MLAAACKPAVSHPASRAGGPGRRRRDGSKRCNVVVCSGQPGAAGNVQADGRHQGCRVAATAAAAATTASLVFVIFLSRRLAASSQARSGRARMDGGTGTTGKERRMVYAHSRKHAAFCEECAEVQGEPGIGNQVCHLLAPDAGHAGEDSQVWVAHCLADAHDGAGAAGGSPEGPPSRLPARAQNCPVEMSCRGMPTGCLLSPDAVKMVPFSAGSSGHAKLHRQA